MWRDYLCNSTEKEAMTSIYFWMRTASAITKEIEWEWAQLMLEAYGTPGSNCEMYLDKNSLEHPNAPVEGTYTFPADMNHCDHAHECCFASIGISFDSSPYLKMKVEATFAGQCRTLGEATEVDTVSVTQCNPQGSISMTMNNRSLEMGKQWNSTIRAMQQLIYEVNTTDVNTTDPGSTNAMAPMQVARCSSGKCLNVEEKSVECCSKDCKGYLRTTMMKARACAMAVEYTARDTFLKDTESALTCSFNAPVVFADASTPIDDEDSPSGDSDTDVTAAANAARRSRKVLQLAMARDSDTDSDTHTEIHCPGIAEHCDCGGDCHNHPDFCSCPDAQACCASAMARDSDTDSDTHTEIHCPGIAEHCDCGGDCHNHPDFCSCPDAQACCASDSDTSLDSDTDTDTDTYGGNSDEEAAIDDRGGISPPPPH
ncbi:hypothetical protein CYMTET_12081 [Cymbomonas tetramitiformis]|uniref:Uncharacterized protein n=1 Tax=Cymbomonas tetramitiformis TaxID=36881 RepID=A0AAE0GL32_9CHLO|nr:hypothetical protein CYMTET_12081 [Cymbomonas tetramitiformis]